MPYATSLNTLINSISMDQVASRFRSYLVDPYINKTILGGMFISTPCMHRASHYHYYKNVDLSRLGNRDNSGFPTGTPVRDKRGALLSRVWQPGQKVQPAPTWLAHPFIRLVLPTGTKGLFFSYFSFLNSFSISIILLHFN